MDTISTTVWQRRGSSIIFDQKSLGRFIREEAVISLRQALSWMNGLPSALPVSGRTILIAGMETLIETLPEGAAEEFLIRRIRPLVIQIQNHWTECGVLFGFSAHEKAFEETVLEEEVLFRRRDRHTIRLSESLWDGCATLNIKRITRAVDGTGKDVTIGYYVAHVS